jgi:hypothetical protein
LGLAVGRDMSEEEMAKIAVYFSMLAPHQRYNRHSYNLSVRKFQGALRKKFQTYKLVNKVRQEEWSPEGIE